MRAFFLVDLRATDGPPFAEEANASQKMQAKPRFATAFLQRQLEKCTKALFQGRLSSLNKEPLFRGFLFLAISSLITPFDYSIILPTSDTLKAALVSLLGLPFEAP